MARIAPRGKAVERGEFLLHYQPQLDVATGRLIGVEALLRWNHPSRGLVPPGEFIQIAEDSGLIVSIGQWVLQEGCRQLRAWQDRGIRHLRLSFNLSPRQFRDKSLIASIADAIAQAGVDSGQIELELTESLVMGSADRFEAGLRELKGLGLSLAVDDFGTGYSSLNYLKRFPIDKLKIDQSFVRDLGLRSSSDSIVAAMIGIARGLEGIFGIAQRRRQNDAVGARIGQLGNRRTLALGIVAFFDHELAAADAGLFQTANQKFAEIGGAGIAVEQSDANRVSARQAAGSQIRSIIQGLDRCRHLGAGGVAHLRIVIDHARNRHRRHAGMASDVMDPHPPPAATHIPLSPDRPPL